MNLSKYMIGLEICRLERFPNSNWILVCICKVHLSLYCIFIFTVKVSDKRLHIFLDVVPSVCV